jgi:hypothetical protein
VNIPPRLSYEFSYQNRKSSDTEQKLYSSKLGLAFYRRTLTIKTSLSVFENHIKDGSHEQWRSWVYGIRGEQLQ